MNENEHKSQGVEMRTGSVTDEDGKFYVHFQLALGMLSAGLAVPVDLVPEFTQNFRKLMMEQYRQTLELSAGTRSPIDVIENKLILP